MPTEIKEKLGTQIRFSGSGFSPADAGTNYSVGTPTDVTLTLSAVADAAGRQSNKADLGATMAPFYSCFVAVDFTGETPAADGTVDVYWAPSASTTAATGNVAGNSGLDAAAPGGALGSITLAEFVKQCIFIGSLPTHDGASVQVGWVGGFSPPERYGQIVVVNNSGDAFEADNVEMAVWLNPVIPESQ